MFSKKWDSLVKKIYLDMDGVLADFVKGVEGPDYINGPLEDEGHYDEQKADFINKRLFRNLPVMPGMLDLIALVKNIGLPWEILTATGEINRPLVVADKMAWIHQHVDPHVVVTCTIKGKHKGVFAKPGDVLVDDKKSNCDAWAAAGGISVHHTSMPSTLAQLEYLANQEDLKVAN